jgi:hypothetical protein
MIQKLEEKIAKLNESIEKMEKYSRLGDLERRH